MDLSEIENLFRLMKQYEITSFKCHEYEIATNNKPALAQEASAKQEPAPLGMDLNALYQHLESFTPLKQ